ncbi:MAG TPA: 50S ribosomal protein L9 [Thermodesulfovibrionales bacterium]|jgi:large subunit ribosomal protein L9|nr:50S ribosomal protein L9 [Thermodesulfovibrionales bacterium]
MKVILKEDVKSLGTVGSVVNVADGYARNYLIPKHLAAEANTKNIKALEHEKKKIEEQAKKIKNAALSLSERLSSLTLTLGAKAGEEEKLFGSITTMDIAEALKKEGFDVDRKKIVLDEPIKRLGTFSVGVKLHHDVTSQVTIQVVPE